MLQFKVNDITTDLYLTLTENVSITDPYYLFVFKHVLTKEVVKFIIYNGADLSLFQDRYNLFTINPSVVFLDATIGSWNYVIYEQASSTNLDIALTGDVLEFGKLILNKANEFTFVTYNDSQSFNVYNG